MPRLANATLRKRPATHDGRRRIVRVAEPTAARILSVLDLGATGVLVPHVNSAAKARDLAAACRHRGGKRGFSNTTRAGGFGAVGIWDHVKAADENVAFIAMIEDPEALDDLDAILSVDGLDGIFIGRGDLTVAFGAAGLDSPEVNQACERIFPAARKAAKPVAVMVATANGRLIDEAKQVCDLIAEGDIILAGGHLHISELFVLFEEASKRGVRKLMVNHPSYIVGCSDDDIRGLVELGAYMEHSICMFIPGRAKQHDGQDLLHLIEVAGVDRTILSSDLGLTQAPKPVDGYRMIVSQMLDLQVPRGDITKLISTNAASLLDLAA